MLDLTIPVDAAQERVLTRLNGLCHSIAPEDLCEGEYPSPRLSLLESLEGLLDPRALVAYLRALPPLDLTLGEVRAYRGVDGDTLAIPVESDALAGLHRQLCKHLHGSARGEDYDPRITLCKVRKGCGQDYAGDDCLDGARLSIAEVCVTGHDGQEHIVKLGGTTLIQPRKKVEFVGQEKPKVVPLPAPAPRQPDPVPVTLKSAWGGLTRDARVTLRGLRQRGTDRAMRKAVHLVRCSTRDVTERGLLLDWIAKRWIHQPGPRSRNRYVNDKTGRVSYFKNPPAGAVDDKGEPVEGSKHSHPEEKPQEAQQGTQAPPETKAGKTQRSDPQEVQGRIEGMLNGKEPADPKAVAELLMGLTVKQAQSIRDAFSVDATGTKGSSRSVIGKIAERIAGLALAGKLKPEQAAPTPEPEPAAEPAPAAEPEPQPQPKKQAFDPLGISPAKRKPSSERNLIVEGGDEDFDPAEVGDDGEAAAEFLALERERVGNPGKPMSIGNKPAPEPVQRGRRPGTWRDRLRARQESLSRIDPARRGMLTADVAEEDEAPRPVPPRREPTRAERVEQYRQRVARTGRALDDA